VDLKTDGWTMDKGVMNLVEEQSLYWTVINVARHLFFGGTLAPAECSELVAWILAHQNRRHGFSFYPTAIEREQGIRLLSGERPQTMLAADSVVEMETLRLLALPQPDAPEVRPLEQRADLRLSGVCYGRVCPVGECAHASISVLRYHAARGAERSAGVIAWGLEALWQARIGEGKWRHFPFYYALLWLTDLPGGFDERVQADLSYAQEPCQRLLSRMQARASGKPFEQVRAKILQDALARTGETAGAQGAIFEAVQDTLTQTGGSMLPSEKASRPGWRDRRKRVGRVAAVPRGSSAFTA
jgi:hypothetical protein